MLVVTAGIIIREGRVLIARRYDNDTMGGLWEFPGGKVEHGETPDMCIRRELREELGVEAEPKEIFDAAVVSDGRIVLLFYICTMKGEPRALECADIRMVQPGEISSFPFAPADMFVAQKIKRYMEADSL